MSPEEQKKLIHTVIDVIFNQQDLDRLEEFFTEDFYNHDGFPGADVGAGREPHRIPAAFRNRHGPRGPVHHSPRRE